MRLLLALLLCASTAAAQIPKEAEAHRKTLTRSALLIWGLDAPVATFAAQIHQESLWRANAVSKAGAKGLAQFMPATGEWIVTVYRDLGKHEPNNPVWAIRAMVTYDLHLYKLVAGANDCERWAKVLSAYNGGLTWVTRDETLAQSMGIDIDYWFGGVETVNTRRNQLAIVENRNYPRRILLELEGVYIDAGFGAGVCENYSPEER